MPSNFILPTPLKNSFCLIVFSIWLNLSAAFTLCCWFVIIYFIWVNASPTFSTGFLHTLFVHIYTNVLFSGNLFSNKGRSSLSVSPMITQSGKYFFCSSLFFVIASLPITTTSYVPCENSPARLHHWA